MTQLKDLEDIQDLEIKSLQDLARESYRRGSWNHWINIERTIIESGRAPSLSAYLLCEYQFKGKSIDDLSEELGVSFPNVLNLMRKMNIPIRTKSEAQTGERHVMYGRHHSDETKRKMSKSRMGMLNWNYGRKKPEAVRRKLSIAQRSPENVEKCRRQAIRTIELLRKNSYNVENRFYASSQQEGAVALLLEKYLDYQVREGENFQVRNNGITNGGIDFLANGKFLEWHPIILSGGGRGDIPSIEERDSYNRALVQIPEAELEDFVRDYEQVLAVNYRNSRQTAVDNSGYAGANVTLATNVCELYHFVARVGGSLPDFDDFRREFNQKIKYVKSFKVQKQAQPAPELAGKGK